MQNQPAIAWDNVSRVDAFRPFVENEGELPYDKEREAELVWARSQVELGVALGCDRRTVSRYLKQDGNPGRSADGRYNITAWKLWVSSHGHLKAAAGSSKESLELKSLQLRNAKAEMEMDQARGELLGVDEACGVLTGLVSSMASRFSTLKHDLAPAVVGETVPEATKRIGNALRDVLADLSLGDWSKKKLFWRNVSRHLSGLQEKYCLTIGLAETSSCTPVSVSTAT